MDKNRVQKEKMAAQLAEWKAEIDQWKAVAKKKQAEVELEHRQDIDRIEEKIAHAADQLERVKTGTQINAAVLDAELRASWDQLVQGMKQLAGRFREEPDKKNESCCGGA